MKALKIHSVIGIEEGPILKPEIWGSLASFQSMKKSKAWITLWLESSTSFWLNNNEKMVAATALTITSLISYWPNIINEKKKFSGLPEPKAAFVDHLIEITPGKHFSSPSGKPAVPVVSSKAKKTQQTNKPKPRKNPSASNQFAPLTQISYFYSAWYLYFLNIIL